MNRYPIREHAVSGKSLAFCIGVLIVGLAACDIEALNINGSGISLNLPSTDLFSGSVQENSGGVRGIFAGTPVAGRVSTSGAGAKVILEPLSLLAGSGNGAPVAEFSADPLAGAAPLDVQFEDLSSGGLYQILAWTWDFGDGSPYSSDQDPSHRYENPGSYTVTLTLMTTGGTVTAFKEHYITVVQPVPALDGAGILLLAALLMLAGGLLFRKKPACSGSRPIKTPVRRG